LSVWLEEKEYGKGGKKRGLPAKKARMEEAPKSLLQTVRQKSPARHFSTIDRGRGNKA